MKFYLIIIGLLVLASCTSSEEKEPDGQGKSENESIESDSTQLETKDSASNSIEDDKLVSLPEGQLKSIENLDFEIRDTIVIQEFEDNLPGLESAHIYMTEDLDIVMGLSNDNGLFEDWYSIEIGDVGPWTSDFTVTLEDLCGDNEEELVLRWETRDGHSGFFEGYEMERQGVMVLNAHSMKAYLDLIYYDHYMTYEAPYEDEMDEEEQVHGKMNENTHFEECSYSFTFDLTKDEISISDYQNTTDAPDCMVPEIEEGVYRFDQKTMTFIGGK